MKSYEQTALNILRGKVEEKTEHNVEIEEASVHPMALHVKPVPGQSKNGQEVYKVHAVGPKVTGIKVGEHLNDTELDDATDAGHKVKMMKEEAEEYQDVEYDVDYTLVKHNSFLVKLDESYSNFVKAANYFCESEEEAVEVANEFYKDRDPSLIIEMAAQESIILEYQDFIDKGHEVTLPKYMVENNDIYAEYVVKDKETGVITRFVHHGTAASVEENKGEI